MGNLKQTKIHLHKNTIIKKMRTSLRRSNTDSAVVNAENNIDSTDIKKGADKENQPPRNSTYTRTSTYRQEPVRTVLAPIHKVEEVCFEQPVRSYSSTVKSSYVHPITQYVEQQCYDNIYTHPQSFYVEQPIYTMHHSSYGQNNNGENSVYRGHCSAKKKSVENKSQQPKPVSVKPKSKKSSNW